MIGLFFALSGLDVLNELNEFTTEKKQSIIDWVYSLQTVNDKGLLHLKFTCCFHELLV